MGPNGSSGWRRRLTTTGRCTALRKKKHSSPDTPPAAEPEQVDADALIQEAFDLINEARAENGLHEVTVNEEAMELAKIRSLNWRSCTATPDRMGAGSPEATATAKSSTAGLLHQ